ncbi:efflux RND transporter periplasmic adaptor subunit [Hyphomicrobium sp. CS1BSMeth3]|uniref:efflux RND transporter periplasmic adaptor subunit n=1 Tax=Hyphomicrobium sp. CS1BSMeth3 TaxID=1892844 RepID=UPI0009F92FC7|nr:efflux RND transporter periplasmic adaptor subunit [Hyphomicrobium sp. CS1BSMeth3]MBN9268044.1 efflux RND transporter periplasmic adaptor subunit [Hyphomicrobium sp.]
MFRTVIAGIALLAILAGGVAGYRLGAGAWPALSAREPVKTAYGTDAKGAGPEVARTVLYWKHPDGSADFSAEPKKTPDGRDFVPVYEDQEGDFKESKPRPAAKDKGGSRKLLYYRNPMGLADTSLVPKKDWMGMDYIPVYEGEDDASTVTVSLDKVQRSGVRTALVERRNLVQAVRSPGTAKPDERSLRIVSLRADGFIEKLYVNETGKQVRAGDKLFRLYSPQIVSAQIDYRTSAGADGGSRNESGALQKLRNLDIPDSVIEALRKDLNPQMSIDWPAPTAGVVMQKRVIEGQMAKAGEELYRIADLTNIWVIADVAEQDLGLVQIGALAMVSFRAFPGKSFEGRVTFVLHELDMSTRTAKVRIEVHNPDHLIKHEMYADVEIGARTGEAARLAVPASAVIDSGNRQVVIVAKGEGRFQPRPVKLGMRADDHIEILDGVTEGEEVVTAANFLIDAESNLKAALQAFTQPAAAEAKP